MRLSLLLIALALAATAAQGQAVYRSVMPDGSIVYGDKPAPGAKEAKEVSLPPPNIAKPPPAKPSAPATTPRQPASESPDDQVRNAERDLQKAKAALEAGREPQPGERIGTAGGASRLTDAYFERIKSLENAIVGAQKKLDDALAQRRGGR
ncbi:MAG: DUF4124 domain-containing protein [Betaproteobacteria bacterium]|nr:DUF4124 domain-containing protein [Betaproteobacteria bacterium]MBI2290019.1 DUF4124 domain-containing protein [Betaproteobacteria bacterium]MBI3056810.1 DUF4124 domain-containing protein [Betaproteobacteria bacterium]